LGDDCQADQEAADDRSAFRSESIELDRFFHRYTGQNQFRHHIGTVTSLVIGWGR